LEDLHRAGRDRAVPEALEDRAGRDRVAPRDTNRAALGDVAGLGDTNRAALGDTNRAAPGGLGPASLDPGSLGLEVQDRVGLVGL